MLDLQDHLDKQEVKDLPDHRVHQVHVEILDCLEEMVSTVYVKVFYYETKIIQLKIIKCHTYAIRISKTVVCLFLTKKLHMYFYSH